MPKPITVLRRLSRTVAAPGGSAMRAYGISGQPCGTLFGRPVIPVEHAEALGTEGDICLVDFSQHLLAHVDGLQAASSMQVAFLSDE